jgi:A/G-specific adenine glycosylase
MFAWYEPRRRAYPWRAARTTAYGTLVSEVMLQQTQAARVAPAYRRFLGAFPSLRSLAAAPMADVVRTWGTLGYNRRAVALHRTAGIVARKRRGRLPKDPAELARLPGLGPYTSAAVASIAFGVPVPAIDVNVARVVSRARLGVDGAPAPDVRAAAAAWLDPERPGDWNQAVMDLGREVCRPTPRCDECPLRPTCAFRGVARPAAPRRRQDPYRGSTREARGAVIRVLRDQDRATVAGIVQATALGLDRIAAAVRSLDAEGMVAAGPAALRGDRRGRVALPTTRRA